MDRIHPVRAYMTGFLVVSAVAMHFLGYEVPDWLIGFAGMGVAFYLTSTK